MIDRALDFLMRLNNTLLIVQIVILALIGFLGCLFLYYVLPVEVRNVLTPIMAAIFSFIMAPTLISINNKRKEREIKRFEVNRPLYGKLLEILIPLMLAEACKGDYIEMLEEYIKSNYSHMYLYYEGCLIEDIFSVYRNLENKSFENVKYFGMKCIRRIRKEGGVNRDILVPRSLGDILL